MVEMQGGPNSCAMLFVQDAERACGLKMWMESFGWKVEICASASFQLGNNLPPALFLIDGAIDAGRRDRLVSAIRDSDTAAATAPILMVSGPDQPDQPGTSGRIAVPLERSDALAIIGNWTGPLGDHGFRTLDNPHYRLVRLAGWELASRLLANFVRHLGEALDALDRGEDVARTAHIITGLAGPLGFTDLSSLWSAVERGESNDVDGARTATTDIMARVGHWNAVT